MHKLVLLRHGQSEWNLQNRFTGWTDVDLTEAGREQAREAGRLLQAEGFEFDLAFTSLLKRAIHTLWLTLDELDQSWVPVVRNWRLNERHYGALQGLNKGETAAKYGEDQVHIWRRSYATPPPPLTSDDERFSGNDRRYAHLSDEIPLSESLADTVERFLPFWRETITPNLKSGKQVIIAAHGNSLRALVQHLSGISQDEITKLNIPTGAPLVFELDADLRPLKNYYLGDQDKIASAMEAEKDQSKAK